jgi:hypothetical protein
MGEDERPKQIFVIRHSSFVVGQQFPFEAEVDEFQERGPLQVGDRLTVLGIKDVDDLYGGLVSCRQGQQPYAFPLADLAAVGEDSPNAQPVQDYCVWFANR